jgi:hypothetical protein
MVKFGLGADPLGLDEDFEKIDIFRQFFENTFLGGYDGVKKVRKKGGLIEI